MFFKQKYQNNQCYCKKNHTATYAYVLYVQKELNQEEALEYLKSQIKGIENAVMYKENINKYLFNVYEVTLN